MPRAGAGWQALRTVFFPSGKWLNAVPINKCRFCGWEVLAQGSSVSQGYFFSSILLYSQENQIPKGLVCLDACWGCFWLPAGAGVSSTSTGPLSVLLDKSGIYQRHWEPLSAVLAPSSTSGNPCFGKIREFSLHSFGVSGEQCWGVVKRSWILRCDFRWTSPLLKDARVFPFLEWGLCQLIKEQYVSS